MRIKKLVHTGNIIFKAWNLSKHLKEGDAKSGISR